MKKIIIILLCIVMCIMLSGCAVQVDKSEQESKSSNSAIAHAMIIMPDGSIIRGKCTAFTRIFGGYAMVKIDGVKYYTNEWRVVIWE